MSKSSLTETDICDQFITPAIVQAGWDQATQIRREYPITAGTVDVRGKLTSRRAPRRADYLLFYENDRPLAVVEAKDNDHPVGAGMQQALAYADALDVPFVFSSNGDGFLFCDRTGQSHPRERFLASSEFPSPDELMRRFRAWKGLPPQAEALTRQPFHDDGSGKEPRYYQRVAVERTVEAIARGQRRVLLAMATGTGKTYTAFQICWPVGSMETFISLAELPSPLPIHRKRSPTRTS